MLGVAGGDEVEWHMGRAADVLVREGPVGPLVAAAHHALAHEIHATHHEHGQDDADDGHDRAGMGRKALTGRGHEICCEENNTDNNTHSCLTSERVQWDTDHPYVINKYILHTPTATDSVARATETSTLSSC